MNNFNMAFRLACTKIIPIAYSQALSYNERQTLIEKTVNKLIQNGEATAEFATKLKTELDAVLEQISDEHIENVIEEYLSERPIGSMNKHLLEYNGTKITEDGSPVTFSYVHDLLLNSPDFVVLIYSNYAYHPNHVSDSQIVFASAYPVNGYDQSRRITLLASGTVTYNETSSERVSNKMSTINPGATYPPEQYPSVSAVMAYTKEILGKALAHQECRYNYWRSRIPKPTTPKTVYFGDSIPAGLRVQPDYAWPVILGRWMLGGTPTNLAVGGATWVEFPDIPTHNTVLQQLNGNITELTDAWGIFIMCGYNDWEQGRTYDAIKAAVDTTIKRIDAVTSNKYVFIVLPIRRCGDEYHGGNVGANVINDFDDCRNAIAAAVLANRGSSVNKYVLLDGRDIPMSRGTPDLYGQYGDGRKDIVHPSRDGHNLIAVTVHNMIPWE